MQEIDQNYDRKVRGRSQAHWVRHSRPLLLWLIRLSGSKINMDRMLKSAPRVTIICPPWNGWHWTWIERIPRQFCLVTPIGSRTPGPNSQIDFWVQPLGGHRKVPFSYFRLFPIYFKRTGVKNWNFTKRGVIVCRPVGSYFKRCVHCADTFLAAKNGLKWYWKICVPSC